MNQSEDIEKNKYENNLVSIIIPVFNSEQYIKSTIESVLRQTYDNWEMVIVDDCSTDQSKQMIQRYVGNHNIHYIQLNTNSGAARARNVGLSVAKGRYIAFLDADDQWKPQKLENQLNFMKSNSYGFTFTGYEIIGKQQNKVVEVPASLDYAAFMKNTIIGMLTVMIDRTVIRDIKIVDIKKDHDSMTWAKILREGNIAYGLNESLAYYRKVSGSISNNKWRAVIRHWKNYREVERVPFVRCCYFFSFYLINALKKHYL